MGSRWMAGAAVDPCEQDGSDDEDVDRAAEHASQHGHREGPHDFGTHLTAPEDGEKAGNGGGDGHDLRPQAEAGAFFYGGQQLGAREGGRLARRVSPASEPSALSV